MGQPDFTSASCSGLGTPARRSSPVAPLSLTPTRTMAGIDKTTGMSAQDAALWRGARAAGDADVEGLS